MTPNPTFPIEVRGSASQPLGMSPTRFLRDYWQKRPLLIRGAFPDFEPPLQPDDLAGLPRTFLDCGTSDGFRDEVLVMAMRMCQAGVLVDLHLWGGGFHGFEFTASEASLSQAAHAARDAFIRRALGA